MKNVGTLCTCLLLASAMPLRLPAQAVYGNVVGVVTDNSGAAVVGALVTIRDIDRDVEFTTTTNEAGAYSQRHLIAGRYQVRASAPGFRTFVDTNVIVSVDAEVRIDIKLQVGEVKETVQVTGESPLLKTERSDIAVTYDEKVVNELPMMNRRFSNLSLLTPGVLLQSGSLNSTESENPMGSYRLEVNGHMYSGVSHLLDGTDNHDSVLAYQVINPTLESVTEAKITTSAFDAEFSNAGAMVVSSQTKSGTNQLHGSAFEFLRNDHLQARDPFAQAQPIYGANGRMIPVTIWNQFGASIGGPIKKNKIFYFGDYQGTRRITGGSKTVWVPTADERAGNLNDLGINIYDPSSGSTPATRTQYPGNIIPANQLSPQAVSLINLLPLPNKPAAPNQPNYQGSGSLSLQEDSFNVRGDDYITQKLHAFGRYSQQRFNLTAPAIFGLAGGTGFDASNFAGTSYSLNRSIAAGFDYVVSPTLVSDFRFGYFRYYVNVNPLGLDTTPAKDAGIPGLNLGTPTTGSMPAFSGLGTSFGFGLGPNNCNCPLLESQHQYQFANNWTRTMGKHTVKFGADVRHAYNLRIPSDNHPSGVLNFGAAQTQGPNGGGSGFASYMTGLVASFARNVESVYDASEMQNRFFFYGQDTWRVSSKLTVNFGLRWEIYRPEYVAGPGKGANISANTGEVLVAGAPGVSDSLNVSIPPKAFAPRAGVAYQMNQKTVVRVGYGRGFDQGIFGTLFGHNVTQNLPVLAIQNVTPAFSYQSVFTLAQGPPAVPSPASILAAQPKGPNGMPIAPNGYTTDIVPPSQRIPTIDNWNVAIQRQLTATVSLEVAFVGSKGTHEPPAYNGYYNSNEPTLVGYLAGLSTNQRRPYFSSFGWTQTVRYSATDASNRYSALQTKIEKRFSKGLQLLGHYTWSRALDYDTTQYIYTRAQGFGPNNTNRNHVITALALWEVPVGRGRHALNNLPKALDLLIGGWQTNGVVNWMTGQPFTPSYQNCSADEDAGWCRPNIVGDWSVPNPSQFGWFATASTLLSTNGQVSGPWQRPQRGTWGNIGRNTLRGPRFSQVDFSLFKEVPVNERIKFQLRGEVFNLFNHTNLGQPTATVDAPGTAGRIFATAAQYLPRTAQLALRLQF
ncbi:MAG TPA: TonB-dependent receptor [Verrucomicrobiae bacterium]|nr:TonB-dependent receptor [Verrucomicrobiae bacterium]